MAGSFDEIISYGAEQDRHVRKLVSPPSSYAWKKNVSQQVFEQRRLSYMFRKRARSEAIVD